MSKPSVQTYQDVAGQWRYRVIAANGERLAASEAYTQQADARRGAEALRAAFANMRQPGTDDPPEPAT